MGFLDKLIGRAADRSPRTRTVTNMRESFKIKVPKANATPVQHALESWAQSKGWAAVVNASPVGDFVEFTFQHEEQGMAGAPDLRSGKMAEELQKVLEDAVKKPEQS